MIPAILIGLLAMAIPFFSPLVQRDKALSGALFVLLVIRQFASFGQVYFDGLPTVSMDPLNFHYQAVDNSGPAVKIPYGKSLAIVYATVGPSHLLGCELSQLSFSLAILVLLEILAFFGLTAIAPRLVLAFGILPSVILNTSVTLREAYQILAFLSFNLGILTTARDGVCRRTLFIPISTIALVFLHQGFGLLVLILLPCGLIWISREKPIYVLGIVAISLTLLLFSGDRIWGSLTEHSSVLKKIESGEGLEYIDGYQESVFEGRTTFKVLLDASSVSGLLKTGPIVMFNYLFAPLPWQIRGSLDVFGCIEGIFRLYLFILAARFLASNQGVPKRYKLLTAAMYLVTEIMWAAGTANWGTAFRHRVVAYGLLVTLAGGGLAKSSTQQQQNRRGKKKRSLRAQIRNRRRRQDSDRAPRLRRNTGRSAR